MCVSSITVASLGAVPYKSQWTSFDFRQAWNEECSPMPYTVAGFRTTILRSGSYNGGPANAPATRLRAGGNLDPANTDQHGMVPAGRTCHAADIAHPDGTGRCVQFGNPTGADDAVFLPFFQNNICSAVVPGNPASNVNYFFTAEMSGCMILIDQITALPAPAPAGMAVGDFIVYHANAMSRCANRATLLTNPAARANTTARNHMLNTLYAQAVGDYTATPGFAVARVGLCAQAVYMNVAWAEVDRKRAQGRTNVEFQGDTNVMGIRVGAAWQFWFQTWGWVTYTRPIPSAKLYKGRTKGTDEPARIWDTGRIY